MSNTILLVEDDEIISSIISHKLEKRNHVVVKVFKGDEVSRNVIRHAPCAVILDIDLPNMNGDEVFKEIRSFYQGVVIFLTSQSSDNTELNCLRLGADDYIAKTKPFDVFYQRLTRLLSNQQEKLSSALLTQEKSVSLYKPKPFCNPIEISRDELDLISSLFAS